MKSFYILDRRNMIVETGGEWDRFALSNDGEAAMASRVTGESLWSFVSGEDTKDHLNAIFEWCRVNRAKLFTDYRCDSPDMARQFKMMILPAKDDTLEVRHRLVLQEPRQRPASAAAEASGGATCSICCRVNADGRWVDPLFEPTPARAPDAFTVCTRCQAEMVEEVRRAWAAQQRR